MPSRFRLIISFFLIFLLIGGTIPGHALAEPAPLVVAAPAVGTMVVGSLETVITTVTIVGIGATIGIYWDKFQTEFNEFICGIENAFDNLIYGARWTRTTSNEGQVVLRTEEEAYYAAAASGSKKPGKDKWYHEARREWDGKNIELNTDRLTEEQAITKLKNGKDVFTLSKNLAEKVAHKITRETLQKRGYSEEHIKNVLKKMEPEKHGGGKPGYYDHYHYIDNNGLRLHIWFKS